MSKRALLVGCNYPGTKVELHGCVNDARRMQRTLVTRFGFDESDILVMLDTDPSTPQPTGANIRSSLAKLAKGVRPGDVLVFHYSGHGTQVPPESGRSAQTGVEYDTGSEEAIVPTDMNLLTDDDFRDLVNQIPTGATFTFISDSCHSGGMIDKEKEQIGGGSSYGPLSGGNHQSSGGGPGGLMGLVAQGLQALGDRGMHSNQTRDFDYNAYGGERQQYGEGGYNEGRRHERREEEHHGHDHERRHGHHEEAGYGAYERPQQPYGYQESPQQPYGYQERPQQPYGYQQQQGYGEYGVNQGAGYGYTQGGYQQQPNYGGDRYAQQGGYGGGYGGGGMREISREIPVEMLTQILSQRTGQNVTVGNIRTTIYNMFGDQSSPAIKTFVNLALQQLGQQGGHQGGIMGTVASMATQYLQSQLHGQSPAAASHYAAPAQASGPPRRHGTSPDVGILLSGCQTNETSADANPSHNAADSYGAFSNAIQTVLSQTQSRLSNRELTMAVRNVLSQTGFKQHPCLYSSDENADAPFICA